MGIRPLKHTTVTIVNSKVSADVKRQYIAYCLDVHNKHTETRYQLWRRFSEFFKLRSTLLKKYARNGYQIHNFPFPPKKWFRSRSAETISKRLQLLQHFMLELIGLEVEFPELVEFLTPTFRTRRGTTAIDISPSAVKTDEGHKSARWSHEANAAANGPRPPSPQTFDEFEAQSEATDTLSELDATDASIPDSTPSRDRRLGGAFVNEVARSAPAHNGSPFLSSRMNRRRSFDETLVVGSPAGQSLMQGHTAHEAHRRVSRALRLETTVQSTLQQSKMAQAELSQIVAEYSRERETHDAGTGAPPMLSTGRPPATLKRLKRVLHNVRARHLALTKKWERDETVMSKMRARMAAEINGMRRELMQSLDQWSALKRKSGWSANNVSERSAIQENEEDSDTPNARTLHILSNWKPAAHARYQSELLDCCEQSGLTSRGYLRKQSQRKFSSSRASTQKRYFYVRDDMTICYRRSSTSGKEPSTPIRDLSSTGKDEVRAIGALGHIRLRKVRESETSFTISSPTHKGSASTTAVPASPTSEDVTTYVLHAGSADERDRWMKALGGLQCVVAPGERIAGDDPLQDELTVSELQASDNTTDHTFTQAKWLRLTVLEHWKQCIESARLQRLNAQTDQYGLCEALDNLQHLEAVVSGFRFVPPVENLQQELLSFINAKRDMCRQKQQGLTKSNMSGEARQIFAGLDDAVIQLPRLKGFFKFVDPVETDALLAEKAREYESNFFPREPPLFFSKSTERWETFSGPYESFEAGIRARFFRLLQLEAARNVDFTAVSDEQAARERAAVESLISAVALVASRDVLMDFMMTVATLAQPDGFELVQLARKIATSILLDCHIIHGSFDNVEYRAVVLESYTVDVFTYGHMPDVNSTEAFDLNGDDDNGNVVIRVACRSRLICEIPAEGEAAKRPILQRHVVAHNISNAQ